MPVCVDSTPTTATATTYGTRSNQFVCMCVVQRFVVMAFQFGVFHLRLLELAISLSIDMMQQYANDFTQSHPIRPKQQRNTANLFFLSQLKQL